MLQFVKENELNADEKKYLDLVKSWDLLATPDSKGQTIYQCWFDSLEVEIWRDELSRVKPQAPLAKEQTYNGVVKEGFSNEIY